MRDDFTEPVKRILAERAAYICSNPECRKVTVGPHSEPNKSIKLGIASHIKAASAGGPRFDQDQTSDERKNIENGIWLCCDCSMLIDKDRIRFSTDALIAWKADHETWIRGGGIIPPIPQIKINTITGFTLGPNVNYIDFDECKDLKEHHLEILNTALTDILHFEAEIQLPEALIDFRIISLPAGCEFKFSPQYLEFIFTGSAGSSVKTTGASRPTKRHKLNISNIPAKNKIAISFRTSQKIKYQEISDPSIRLRDDIYVEYIEGVFRYVYRGASLPRYFLSKIIFNETTRAFSLGAMIEDKGVVDVMISQIMA